MGDSNTSALTDPAVDQGGSKIFNGEFDVYLTELKAPEKSSADATVAGVKLITYAELEEIRTSTRYTLRTLPISKLRSWISAGYFCLKKKVLTEINGSTTLEDYARRQPDSIAGASDGGSPSLSVFWTRTAVDLQKVLKQVKDPTLPDVKPTDVKAPETKPLEVASAISTNKDQVISMSGTSAGDSLYNLDAEQWSHVIAANELLYGFQVDTEQTEILQNLKISAMLSSAASSDSATEVTSTSSPDPLNLMPRCARPAFALISQSAAATQDTGDDETNSIHAGTFWGHAMTEAKTEIVRTQDSLQVWSTKSGVSKNSLNIGASIPIGKATLGAKFGFQREKSKTAKSKTTQNEVHFMAVHSIPKAQININETTVALSSDAEAEIKKLRQQRRFSDLLRFYEKFGTLVFQSVVLGGRLFTVSDLVSSTVEEETSNSKQLKSSANASLNIAGVLDGNLGGSYGKGGSKGSGSLKQNTVDNVSWTSIGGNPALCVDPPLWRASLGDHSTWRPIQYENAVRIDDFIGRLEGFSDVPVLFATILATGVLDRSIIAIPPTGSWQSKTNQLKLGTTIDSRIGLVSDPPPQRRSMAPTKLSVAPAGFSWAVFSTDRSLKREIRANLQATLNPMINVTYTPPFLAKLRANRDTFTVMLRWSSATWKETEDEAITNKMQEYLSYKQSPPMSEVDKQNSRAAELEALTAGKTDEEKVAIATAKNAEWAAEDLQTAAKIQAMAPFVTEEKTLIPGNFYIQSLTSRSWIVGLWKISRPPEMSDTDFMEHRVAFEREFGEPKDIEEGCDYILTKASSKESRIDANFKMYASDGNERGEITQPQGDKKTLAKNAFEYIDARMRLSNIHSLYVEGEIVNYDGSTPAESLLNEPVLLQIQEAQAGITFLQAKGRDTTDLTKELDANRIIILDKSKVFDVSVLDDIRDIEDSLPNDLE